MKPITIFHFHHEMASASARDEMARLRPSRQVDGGMAMTAVSGLVAGSLARRAPTVIICCGCLIAILTFGPRATTGFFLQPMSQEYQWGRDVFGLALAIQNLLWGVATPFAGAIADRFGTIRVLSAGAIVYALGLGLMAYSTTPLMLHLSAGVLIGFGLAGCSFNIVLGAFGKLVPESWRMLAFGAGTAAGSFGQFLFSPIAVVLIRTAGWQETLITFGAIMLLVLPLALALATPRAVPGTTARGLSPQSLKQALAEALGHRSYVLLVLGFFTCGFQIAFVTVHLPAYLVDRGLSAEIGGWTLGVIGLFNVIGSISSGWLGERMPKRYLLSTIYLLRSLVVMGFVMLPASAAATLVFGASMGLLWLSTVPPTSALIVLMFGTRWFAMLNGLAFFSHQVGSFLGVWFGGVAFERTGSYDVVWWLCVLFGVLSALINLPIVERPVERTMPAAA
jgi:MFS family permease